MCHDRFIHNNTGHKVRHSDRNLIRLWISQTDRQAALGIKITKKNLFTFLRQTYTEIDGRCRFAHAALLVGDCNG